MTYLVVVADQVAVAGLRPLLDDDRFEVREVGPSQIADEVRRADALIVRSATAVDAGMLESAENLRVVGRAGVGVDNIDVPAATRHRVAVFNAPGANTIAAAELTMALILATVRKVAAADHALREGHWDRTAFRGSELAGKTLGLVGAGRIGAEVAARCRAFGMKVCAYDPYLSDEAASRLELSLSTLEEVLSGSDVVSVHVPLNEETRGLIGRDAMARMRPGCYLVNVARGGVVDEEALANALGSGHLAGAALDVFQDEPLPDTSPLRAAPNLVMTPHLGASTREAQLRVAEEVAESVRRALLEGDVSGAVNAADLG
jgi:D-3-phosphoglycerate dehydrogenase / 2-oxoglutarate reductase